MNAASSALRGLLVGVATVVVLYLPAFVFGSFPPALDGLNIYLLLPAFALLLVPGTIWGYLAGRRLDQRESWRFGAGLFVGGSDACGVLLLLYLPEPSLLRRLDSAIFAGLFLGGLWLWMGSLLGATQGTARRERAEAAAST